MRRLLLTLCVIGLATGCSEKKVNGPTPLVTDAVKRDVADLNPRIMWQATATPVTVTGDKFVPMAADTFLDKVFARVPKLYLVNATSSTLLDAIVWVDRQSMLAEIPAGIEIADPKGWEDFQIVAVDPSGRRGEPGGSFRVSTFETPELTGAQIAGGVAVARFCDTATASTTPIALTVLGKFFVAGATIEYGLAVTGAEPAWAPATVTGVTAGALTATIPAGLAAGQYSIRITNIDGQIAIIDRVFTVEFYTCPPPTASISAVTPRFAYREEDVMLQVSGAGFVPTPKIVLRQPQYSVPISYEAYLSATAVQGLLYRDSSRPLGWYSLALTNPGDVTEVTAANAVLVLDQPIPKIDTVTPDSFALSSPNTLTIRGQNFPVGVTVDVYYKDATNNLVFFSATTTAAYASVITATIPLGTIGVDTSGVRVLVLRVYKQTSFGPVWGEYSNLVITGSSGNTGPVGLSPRSLSTPRMQFGLAGGRNGIGTRFLYAVGGRQWHTGPVTATATVEIAPIDLFGELGDFYFSPTTLGTSLYGVSVVEHEGWLYASGGTSPAGYSNQVRKAKILDPRNAPVVVSVAAIAGSLAAGNWIYQVAAVMNGGDAENPNGESLPSIEVAVELTAAGGARLTWKPVANAAAYRIYRVAAANDPSGSEKQIAQVACCTYDDTGAAVGTKAPSPQGSLSVWQPAGTLATGRAFHVSAVARDANDVPYLYVLGGKDNAGPVANYEYSGAFVGGANLTFTAAADAGLGRIDAGVAVATKTNVTAAFRGTSDWLTVYSGCSGANGALSDARNAAVSPGGALTGFVTDGNSSRAGGTGVLFTNDRLFQFGGSIGPNGCVTPNPTAGIQSGLLDAVLSWSNPNANGGNNLLSNRAYFGFTRFNAQIFIVGGLRENPTTANLEVTNAIESLFY